MRGQQKRIGSAAPAAVLVFVVSRYKIEEELSMNELNANVDYCGIRNLLRLLAGQGFTEAELKKIAARIAQESGADIIFC
jgi:hypothetical protein